ncbi:uncharacterized protein BCR38DRAFT_461764 [Pseudomassariella vexata]|uniref:Uncharacterized protein n=1 Tax=Pseudomassariella vexata TaxID=1141098 RepID=A0A1Y2DAH4_9PEZI|nr:uncharacterized protein BCR38DRAFT_461764 [Pseudomassariella vexata]ORY56106.1 hypothetical protein BCR38DRAFT_461764 [Pseudomassariella vexata]
MLMRSGRLVPLFSRYGVVLLAALVVYFIVRSPVASRFSHSNVALGKGEDALGPNKIPAAQGEEGNGGAAAGNGGLAKIYKKPGERYAPIEDPFPWLTKHNKMPPILPNNLPPNPHVPEHTPLFIGFTRNWPMLLQCVCSYIAAGWPASDIYVVENTGTFRSNKDAELSLQNPFFLNHTQLRTLGVHVLMTPTLLNFAQLQNFYLHTSLQRGWEHFFWSHQDVIVFSDEEVRKKDRDHDHDHDPYATIYERAVGLLRYLNGPDMPAWATHFFAYDHLTLVNRDAMLDVGAWDTHIPFYASDCDMYLRLHWAGYWQPQSEAGLIFDVSVSLDDVGALFRLPGSHATFGGDAALEALIPERPGKEVELRQEQEMKSWVDKEGETYQHLVQVAGRMQEAKWVGRGAFRNSWQARQSGGEGEPFHHHPEGFEQGINMLIDAGRRVFAEKWGHRGCNLLELGIEGKDAWKLEKDWDAQSIPGEEGGDWGKDWMGV